jgi:6-phosphogluconolactonase
MENSLHYTRHDSLTNLWQSLATTIAQQLTTAINTRGIAHLALSGGTSHKPLFEALALQPIQWSKVHVHLVDERIVPYGHPDSNAATIKQHLCHHEAAQTTLLEILPHHFQAEQLSDIDRDTLLAASNQTFEKPTVCILGMGLDGHTASLFYPLHERADLHPNEPAYIATLSATKTPRIGFNLAALLSSEHLHLPLADNTKLATFTHYLDQAKANNDPSTVAIIDVIRQRTLQKQALYIHCLNASSD